MRESEKEIAQRALLSALECLQAITTSSDAPQSLDYRSNSENVNSRARASTDLSNPVVVIMFGPFSLHNTGESGDCDCAAGERANSQEKLNSSKGKRPFATQALHPVLEKFPIAESDANAPSPKTCFIESDRLCIGSGACEMRGY